jgi:CheY-like chemotaxis protein
MESRPVRILLVEDDPDDVWMIRSLLSGRWEGPYELIHVEFLSEALECCALGPIDVVLLDLSLPDSRGLETFLVMSARQADAPIIILTGLDDETTAVRAVQAGAQDYLVKNQVNDTALLRSIRYGIERNRRRLAEHPPRIPEEEIRLGQELHRRLAAAAAPAIPGFDVAGGVFPATVAGGGYYDHFPLSDGGLAVALGAAIDKSSVPNLVMVETRACLRALAQTTGDLGLLLARANRFLASAMEQMHAVGLAVVRLGGPRRSLVYASAAQRGYLAGPEKGRSCVLESTCPPLGIQEEISVLVAPPLHLPAGHLVAFFTAGPAAEVAMESHETIELLERLAHLPAREILDELHTAVRRHCRPPEARHDVAAMVIKAATEP